MIDKNNSISFSKDEILEIFVDIEYIMVSLAEIGRYYSVPENNDILAYNAETTKFIDDNGVTTKLANIRKLINSKFDLSLGDDDMDDLERACEDIKYWKRPDGRQ